MSLIPLMLAAPYGYALLMIAVNIPLILGWVGPNGVYGVRTSQTLSDPEVWYADNAYFGWVTIILMVVAMAAVFWVQKIWTLDTPERAILPIFIPIAASVVSAIVIASKY